MSSPVRIDSGGHRDRVLAARDALVVEHMYLVPPIAARIKRGVPDGFDLDDLEGAGYYGLLRAATRFRPKRHGGTPFKAFATPAIRGAILDSIRRKAWEEGTRVSVELADVPDLGTMPSLDTDIDEQLLHLKLVGAIALLPADQRGAIEGFCLEQSAATIGAALGLAEWRVEREHADAIVELRRRLAR